jgi:hypothetical protein
MIKKHNIHKKHKILNYKVLIKEHLMFLNYN